jgi:hypothetical protein
MRHLIPLLLLLAIASSVSACVVEEPGPGPEHDRWCFWHPGRCH